MNKNEKHIENFRMSAAAVQRKFRQRPVSQRGVQEMRQLTFHQTLATSRWDAQGRGALFAAAVMPENYEVD